MSNFKDIKSKLIKDFAINANDTGSVEVQCAVLTEQIKYLTGHLKQNPKDFQARVGLLAMVNKRKRLLSYYKKSNLAKYQQLLPRLGLKK